MMVHRFFFLYCKTEKNGGKGFFVRSRKSLTTDVSYGSLKPLKDYFYNRFLLTGLSKEALTEVSDLVKRSFEFADRERCRYFTMIRGAKHYHNCLVVSRVLEELPAGN